MYGITVVLRYVLYSPLMGPRHITISPERGSRNQSEKAAGFTVLELPSEPGKGTEMQENRDNHSRLKT